MTVTDNSCLYCLNETMGPLLFVPKQAQTNRNGLVYLRQKQQEEMEAFKKELLCIFLPDSKRCVRSNLAFLSL